MKGILVGIIAAAGLVCTWDLVWWAVGVKPFFPWRLRTTLSRNAEAFDLIDVRTRAEYQLFHIDGAKHHPELLLHPELFTEPDPGKTLVVICLTGHRSPVVVYRLKKRGFRKIYNLTWGMLGWLLSGGEIRATHPSERDLSS